MKTLVIPEGAVYAGNLILVNGQYPYRAGIAEDSLVPVNSDSGKVLLERRAFGLLSRLMDDIRGWTQISAVSGWRSKREQQSIYDQSLRENGADFTERFVARPDHSEHQTGLAIDLGLKKPEIDFIRPDFPYSGICQTFREKAVTYGFIERYPRGKETVTGIAQEPWHFRYVGAPPCRDYGGAEPYAGRIPRFSERVSLWEEAFRLSERAAEHDGFLCGSRGRTRHRTGNRRRHPLPGIRQQRGRIYLDRVAKRAVTCGNFMNGKEVSKC